MNNSLTEFVNNTLYDGNNSNSNSNSNNSNITIEGIDSETTNEDIIEKVLKEIDVDYEYNSKIVLLFFNQICWKIYHDGYFDMIMSDYQITMFSLMIQQENNGIDFLFNNEHYNIIFYKLSKRELVLLKSYIIHIYNRGVKSEYKIGSYIYDGKNTVFTNEKTIFCIKKCIENIEKYKNIIYSLEEEVSSFSTLSIPILNSSYTDVITGNSDSFKNNLGSFLKELDNHIRELDSIYYSYSFLKNNLFSLDRNKLFLKKEELRLALYNRSLCFNIELVSRLPQDMVLNIKEYIGISYLEDLRKYSVSMRYFPNKKNDLLDMLRTWRKKDLRNYMRKMFLHYSFRYKDIRSLDSTLYVMPVLSYMKKNDIINVILTGTYKGTFYELHRDVRFLTRFLKERRICFLMARRNGVVVVNISESSDSIISDSSSSD